MNTQLYRPTGEGPPDALFTSADGEVTEGWLADAGSTRPSEPVRYVFTDVVAAWFSTPEKPVQLITVNQWIKRYPECPRPAAALAPKTRGGRPKLAWTADAEAALREWRQTLPGQGSKGIPSPAKGWYSKTGPAVRAMIGAGVADEVLAAFPYRAPVEAGWNTRTAEDAAGGRLLVTGSGGDRVVHARDQADADAAAAAMPELVFERVSGGDSAG